MNTRTHSREDKGYLFGFFLAGLCILLGLVTAFRTPGAPFSEVRSTIASLSFEGVSFGAGFRRAMLTDAVFCLAVLVLGPRLPASVLPGIGLYFKSFCLGGVVGAASGSLELAEAFSVIMIVFVCNFLVLPLKVLLFVSSVRQSGEEDSLWSGYGAFALKVAVFFGLMCLGEAVQLGIAALVSRFL